MIILTINFKTSKLIYFCSNVFGILFEICAIIFFWFTNSFNYFFIACFVIFTFYIIKRMIRMIRSYKNIKHIRITIENTKNILYEYDFKIYLTDTALISLSHVMFAINYSDIERIYVYSGSHYGKGIRMMKIVDKNKKKYELVLASIFESGQTQRNVSKEIARIIREHNSNVGIKM